MCSLFKDFDSVRFSAVVLILCKAFHGVGPNRVVVFPFAESHRAVRRCSLYHSC